MLNLWRGMPCCRNIEFCRSEATEQRIVSQCTTYWVDLVSEHLGFVPGEYINTSRMDNHVTHPPLKVSLLIEDSGLVQYVLYISRYHEVEIDTDMSISLSISVKILYIIATNACFPNAPIWTSVILAYPPGMMPIRWTPDFLSASPQTLAVLSTITSVPIDATGQ